MYLLIPKEQFLEIDIYIYEILDQQTMAYMVNILMMEYILFYNIHLSLL
jgi:hypothetical protein